MHIKIQDASRVLPADQNAVRAKKADVLVNVLNL
jgi:hypothetical protein